MPTIIRFDRCRLVMYFDDHAPPHFHVITNDGREAAYRIDTLACWTGEPLSDAEEALAWAAQNRDTLYARWQEYSEPQS